MSTSVVPKTMFMAYVTDGDSVLAVTPKKESNTAVYFYAKQCLMSILIETLSHRVIKHVIIATLYKLRGAIVSGEEEEYISSIKNNDDEILNYFCDFIVRGTKMCSHGCNNVKMENDVLFNEFCMQLQQIAHVYYDINVRPVVA